jgi:hypothetical protein
MRPFLTLICFAAALLGAGTANAERRTFIIASNADGYGVDRCLASGAACGIALATAYCRAHDFEQAVAFRKIARTDITGTIAASAAVCSGLCDELVAIECGR